MEELVNCMVKGLKAFMEKKAKAILASSKQKGLQQKFLSEQDLADIDACFIESHQQVLLNLLDLDEISNEDLKEIWDEKHSKGSDAARRQLIKLFS